MDSAIIGYGLCKCNCSNLYKVSPRLSLGPVITVINEYEKLKQDLIIWGKTVTSMSDNCKFVLEAWCSHHWPIKGENMSLQQIAISETDLHRQKIIKILENFKYKTVMY